MAQDRREPGPALIDPALLGVTLRRGTPDRMEVRFVVSFDESGSLSGRVPATTLATWMGRLRELALAGLKTPILAALESGRYGMVTQNAWVRLDGDAAALDQVEARVWVEELRPSTCLLRFAFDRVDGDRRASIGEAAQRFGWVEVLGHGQIKAASFPAFLQSFLAALHHDAPSATPRPLLLPARPAIATSSVVTGLVDGNVVGNLYYANYFKWAQRALDQLVLRNAPDVLRARGQLGELAITGMRLEYLREAMPFDTLELSVHPAESPELAFDVLYQRREADGTLTRLAIARIDAAWIRTTTDGRAPAEAPAWIRPLPHRPEILHAK